MLTLGVCMSESTDTNPPTITEVSLGSNGPSQTISRIGQLLTLTFRVIDNFELLVTSPPPSFAVTIGGVLATYSSASNQNQANRLFTYTWSIPVGFSGSSVGCSINASDAAGNWRVRSSEALIFIGKLRSASSDPACTIRSVSMTLPDVEALLLCVLNDRFCCARDHVELVQQQLYERASFPSWVHFDASLQRDRRL